jgi:hypothetical protein
MTTETQDVVSNHFQRWAGDKVIFTGRVKNANKMAKPFLLFNFFVEDHPLAFEELDYVKLPSRAAGRLSHVYPIFRDQILLQALRSMRADELNVCDEDVPEIKYNFKRQRREDQAENERTPRAIMCWEFSPAFESRVNDGS